MGFLCARCRSGLFTSSNLGVNSEFVLTLKKAFKRIEELTQKKVIRGESGNTTNLGLNKESDSLRKVAEKIGISEPTLSEAFESSEE